MKLLYLLVLLPWITDYVETRRFPASFQEAVTEIALSALVAFGVSLFLRHRAKIVEQSTEIDRLAGADPLTGLGNVRSLQEVLAREVARARRIDRPLSCVLMDLDDFRMINDQYGHEKGNRVLQVVAETIRGVIRQEMDRAFRYGGDEFMIILPEAGGHQALAVAQRLREVFISLQPPVIPKKALPVSIGIAELREGFRSQDLLRLLDRAIVQAKSRGKNIIYDAKQFED